MRYFLYIIFSVGKDFMSSIFIVIIMKKKFNVNYLKCLKERDY